MPYLINCYATVTELPPKTFPHEFNSERDRNDPELAPHLDGFCNFVASRGDGKMNQLKFHLIQHILRTRHQTSLTIQESHFPAFSEWARAANALLFIGQGYVVDPFGRTLLDPGTAESEAEAEIPYPQDALLRKSRHMDDLARRGWKVPLSLPPVLGESEVVSKAPREVSSRCVALMVAAVRAEAMAHDSEDISFRLKADYSWAWEAMTPKERAFMNFGKPEEQELLSFTWRYEALNVLAWALGLEEELSFPTAVCDVSKLVGTIINQAPGLRDHPPRLRTLPHLLDQLDQHYRLHWIARQARLDGKEAPGDLNQSVIQERHHALNWLLGFGNVDVAWDDIDTPT